MKKPTRKHAAALPLNTDLPHDDMLEKALLGAILLTPQMLTDVQTFVNEGTFYTPANKLIWTCITSLAARNIVPDILTLTADLRTKNCLPDVGGAVYIARLTNAIGSMENVPFMARVLVEKQMLRQMIDDAEQLIAGAYNNTDPFLLLDSLTESQNKLNQQLSGASPVTSIKYALAEADASLQNLRIKGNDITGVGTGFQLVDELTAGLQPGELYILAARPGMGKTAFALQLARNAAVQFKVPTAIFSLEMPRLQLTNRLQSAEAKIPLSTIKKAQLTDEQYNEKNKHVAALAASALFIDDSAAIDMAQLAARAKMLHYKHNIGLVVIDYLQLIMPANRHFNSNREQDIANISRALKMLAKELNIPVVALSQLSRGVEARADKRPCLADLRESGAIEQDADWVGFLYRPGYYKIESDADGRRYPQGYTDLIVAKHRNGTLAELPFAFVPQYQYFEQLIRVE